MKLTLLILLQIVLGFSAIAQTTSPNYSGLRLSVRGGYDFPTYNNNTPYIDYKGGLSVGASLNYYWNWIGIGADFDYIKNKPKNTYPTTNLFAGVNPITTFTLQEKGITRMFYGLGPSFKYQRNDKFSAELSLRAGLASIKGGRTELIGALPGGATLLNFHAGYDAKNVFSAKGQLQFNYHITNTFGLHAGAYYLHHFKTRELVDPVYGVSTGYIPFTNANNTYVINGLTPKLRIDPCEHSIHSIGLFAGVTLAFGHGKKVAKCPVCGKRHYPQCCQTCGCNITVTARDKFTKEVLPNTDVVLTNESGAVIQSGITNSFGTVVFSNVNPGNYGIKGKLYNVALENGVITATEFERCKETGGIQKEILYTDDNFILKGKVVVCNTPTPLPRVTVVLKNLNAAEQKNTLTDSNGEFIFHALQNSSYNIYGKKENYFSQTEVVSTKDFDRNKTLFIKLEVCMEDAGCGKDIVLKNILYDLDKYFIREDAKPELNRLVQFMKDNPLIKVELSSHTDSRESDEYNQRLSQNRANAAVDYIVSQGISRDRLKGVGYGEKRLLNRCKDGVNCTEAEHQINRRTEMKVICP